MSDVNFEIYDHQAFVLLTRVFGGISICFGFFGMFMTLFKSPKIFGAYKYFLFNISFCLVCADIYTAGIFVPKLMFPALIMCSRGLLESNNIFTGFVGITLFIIVYGASAFSVVAAFIFRYSHIKRRTYIVLSKPFIASLVLAHFLYLSPCFIFNLLGSTDRVAIDRAILHQWPSLRNKYNSGCSAVHFSITWYPVLFISSVTVMCTLAVIMTLTLAYKSLATLKQHRSEMSTKTYQLQKQLVISLVFQIMIPVMCLYGPFSMICLFTLLKFEVIVPYMVIGAFLLIYCHSPLNTLMMLAFLPYYRRRVIQLLWGKAIPTRSAATVTDVMRVYNSGIKRTSINSNQMAPTEY